MILITGGARCGKSRHAQQLAEQAGARVLYIATSQVMDDEMAQRVAHHQASRPAHWRTLETWRDLPQAIDDAPEQVVLIECVTTWITNLLFAKAGETPEETWDYAALEAYIVQHVTALTDACARSHAQVIIVTNEVGMGIVPENRLARHFRDIAGRVNQQLAQAASELWLVISGTGVKIK
ncbi:bifunctional adenosylcobinamide kinase/adenosylcobinamide-phosphate guanylyltransferase [Cronobacter turicensis]|uniref:bifunctional adenosylcobinamide kinase/adenosylcobinamide-phosphate guanylyltransferase n=1 Tax=Cronobacter turicensis TaxID=413502 RepID=UPI0013759B6E|nr:bifunctional adenosylcobinamide kinase/adenosylcobinamide-phosphate guanylyltransferase [Cronobacter turicensis]MEB8538508.1 bifunctional adenosylcobinamide kinase/adenosylcobinamide-phosphate guanylyltransferase [Cronobacter sakazakii]EKM0527942.1 bifunctional adenosylcobinamide kinase/adenosylcobinamide-phosphate guanylyltransferase [Cronobacter turicensis]ELQ5999338.1 bifunctional adenosylcobinamide kinase/adenosylcobinamide-phosphate guanylyltransferase [Cronobacter turicensis]ELQ6128635